MQEEKAREPVCSFLHLCRDQCGGIVFL